MSLASYPSCHIVSPAKLMHEVRLETVTHKKVGKQVSSGLSWKQYEAQFAYRLRPCTMQPHGSPRNISAEYK